MGIQEMAKRLVELSRKGDFTTVQNELFSPDAVSIEPAATPAFEKETKGMEAMREKNERWDSLVEETHGIDVSDPLVAENCFAVKMVIDITLKGQGRMVFNEICVYQVKDGKIISEQFFY